MNLGQMHRFGALPDGRTVDAVWIGVGALRMRVLDFGAVVQDLRIEGVDHPLVLGFEEAALYARKSPFCGATVGRYANRIAEGRFTLEGVEHQLDRNENGRHHLHGGSASFGRRPWAIAEAAADSVLLRMNSPDGDGGYPGAVEVSCRIQALPPATLRLDYEGRSDRPTILNLAHHGYFNLDDSASVLDHRLSVAAEEVLPVGEGDIPTGEVLPVAGTFFDFRKPRALGEASRAGSPLDHNFVLARDRRDELEFAARVEAPPGRIAMEVWTTEPGLQVYDGYKLNDPAPGLGGRRYRAHAGLCLEPQLWPDSPNRPGFPNPVLRPGEIYRQVTEYRFLA